MKHALLCLTLFTGCAVHRQKDANMHAEKLDVQGHRGCRGLMPENTIQGFLKAIDLGVTTLEMDAVITKDNQVILSHEPFLNHEITTRLNGDTLIQSEQKELNIYRMTYDEVKQFDVGVKPHARFPQQQKMAAVKPRLADVIDSVELYIQLHNLPPVNYNIETKSSPLTDNLYHPQPEQFVDLLVGVILQKGISQKVIIQSFDMRTLQYLHKKYPEFKTALLIEDFDVKDFDQQIKLLGFNPTIYSPAESLVTKQLVQQCHNKKVKVIPWTINNRQRINELIVVGVDGIITDYPNLFN